MSIVTEWKTFNKQQRNAFVASYLGWTLDAFDFFLMVFCLRAVARRVSQ
jgi:SHS family lactate transporter-like MFS transporter